MASYNYILSTGIIVPDTSELLEGVQDEFRTALGANLSIQPSTPQGRLIAAETTARSAVLRNNATLANQINPNYSGGIFLRAIGKMTGLDDVVATKSTLSGVLLTGIPNTNIPSGSRAKTGDGDQFELISAVVLDSNGNGTGNFQSVEDGPVPALAATLTGIVAGYGALGWETVTNPNDAVLGAENLSDQAYRQLRRNTLALQGIAMSEAITSALWNIPGVLGVQYRENWESTPETIDGIDLVANSVWACVDGGTDADIAQALVENKSGGCAWNGTEEVDYTDPYSGQTYTTKFDRPTEVPIQIRLTAVYSGSAATPEDDILNAILTYANNQVEGNPGFILGNSGKPFEVGAAVNSQVPGVAIQNVEFSAISPISWSNAVFPVALDEKLTVTSGSITIILS